jgi:hypothetical protein
VSFSRIFYAFLKILDWDKRSSLFYYTIARRILQGTKTVAYFAKLTITQKDWMCNSQVSSKLSKKILFGTNSLAYFTINLPRESCNGQKLWRILPNYQILGKTGCAILKYLLDFLKNLVLDKRSSLFYYPIAERVSKGTNTLAYFTELPITQKDWICHSQLSSMLSKKSCFGQMV